MEKHHHRSIWIWAMAALVCVIMLCMPARAASLKESWTWPLGPGDHFDDAGNLVSLNGEILVTKDGTVLDEDLQAKIRYEKGDALGSGSPAEISAVPNYLAHTEGDQTVYSFEGKDYRITASYGIHKLSGYNPTPEHGSKTYSGKTAVSKHTIAAASDLPIGTVVFLKPSSGPYPDEYTGLYVVEDRGGYYIEEEGWIDIFFDTEAEAQRVTDAGWNYAEIWIAEPLS